MKQHYFRIALWVLGLLMLLSQLYYWGGIAHSPVVGAIAKERAKFSSPLMASYIFLGHRAVGLFGVADSAVESVKAQTDLLAQILPANPNVAPRELHKAMPDSKLPGYYLSPILLLLAAFLQLRKPKQISTFARR
jgi:hypothetical protein